MQRVHYDYDSFDEPESEGSNSLLHSRALLFVVVSVVSLAILSVIGFLLHTLGNAPSKIAVHGLNPQPPPAHALSWNGVTLGSRLGAVAAAHPEMRIDAQENGPTTGILVTGKDTLRASFLEAGSGGAAYRMQLRRTIPGTEISDAMAPFVTAYRAPNSFQCRENPLFAARECEAVWWLPDSTRLDVLVQVTPPNSHVVATATQLHLEGLAGRSAGRPR